MDDKKKRLEHLNLSENIVSATECTGLTPSSPLDESQAMAYQDLYAITAQQPNDVADADRKVRKESRKKP